MAQVAATGVFFLFLAISCVQIQLNSSLNFDIDPLTYDGINSKNVIFSCRPDVNEGEISEILFLEMFEKTNNLLATVKNGTASQPTEDVTKRFHIDGQVSGIVNDSFLQLTLLKPTSKDSGLYSCAMYYKDQSGIVKTTKANRFLSVNNVHVTLRTLEDTVSMLETAIGNRAKQRKAKLTTVDSKYRTIKPRQDSLIDKGTFSVSFSAALSKNLPFATGKTIVFPTVISQRGQGYNKRTGVFTAPRSGLYFFYLGVGNTSYYQYLLFLLTVNGRVVAHVDTGSDAKTWRDANSVSSVIELNAGEKVKVVMGRGGKGSVRGDNDLTMFGGHIINAY